MTKLATVRSRFTTGFRSRLDTATKSERERTAHRYATQPYRRWYNTERWKKLKHKVFVRDAYRCQRTGALCIGKHPEPNSPTCHHKVRHNGDPALFWSIDNLETVSKEYHDTVLQAEEAREPRGVWY